MGVLRVVVSSAFPLLLWLTVATLPAQVETSEPQQAAVEAPAAQTVVPEGQSPLWSALWQGNADDLLAGETSEALGGAQQSVRVFAAESTALMVLQLLLYGLFAVLLWLAGKRARLAAAEKEDLKSAAQILSHPLALALLPAVFLNRLLYTDPPVAWILLTQLLLVIPLIRILPLIAGAGIRPLIPWLAGVFVFDRLTSLIADTLLERLAMLVVAGVTLVILFRLRGILLGLGKSRPRWARPCWS